jgi:hypothetical protein
MAKTRSPRYPNIPLGEAIARVRAIYQREHMSPLSPAIAAEAMGYGGLNGTSLKVISSLRKYGLLEGRGEDVRVSTDAQTLIIEEPTSQDYRVALRRCGLNPELFSELKKQFPGQASDRNISVYLERQGFKPDAAALTAKNFRETVALVEGESGGYGLQGSDEQDRSGGPMQTQVTDHHRPAMRPAGVNEASSSPAPLRVVMNGNRLDIQASVDLEGIKRLKEMLTKYEEILKMYE